jgi:hypothetical protein
MDLPIDAALARYVDLGKSGAGKSNTLIVKAEEFIRAGVPVWEMDPLGNLYGQRSGADGNSAGLPIVVFGGAHADLELPSATSACDLVAHERLSAIFDLSELEWTEQRAFAEAFCTHLIYLADRIDLVGHLMLDEADRFAPNTIGYNACKVFARVARNKSIGWTFSTQRPQILSPEVIESANVICAMRIPSDLAQESILRKVSGLVGKKRAGEMIQQLAAMKKGECWFIPDSDWLPHLSEDEEAEPTRFRWRLRDTFDSTSPRRIGEARIEAKVTAEIDIDRLREKLATSDDVVTNSTNDSNSTKYSDEEDEKLRCRIEELEGIEARYLELVEENSRLANDLTRAAVAEAQAVERPVFAEPELKAFSDLAQRLFWTAGDLKKLGQSIVERIESAMLAMQEGAPLPITREAVSQVSTPQIAANEAAPNGLSGPDTRFLTVLWRRSGAKTTRRQLGALAKYSPKSSTFANYVSSLRVRGYISADGGLVAITDAGRAALGKTSKPSPIKPSELLESWCDILGGSAARMLRILVEHYPRDLTRSELAERAGMSPTSSTFANYVSLLRTNGLAIVRTGVVKANPEELML